MVSRRCDHCCRVKRCRLALDAGGRIAYVCRTCSRELEYPEAARASVSRSLV